MSTLKKQPIKHLWSMFCQRSLIDGNTNSISLIDIIEQLNITADQSEYDKLNKENDGAIKIPLGFELVNLWDREDDLSSRLEKRIAIDVFDPQGKKIISGSNHAIFEKDKKRMRMVNRFSGFKLTSSGKYKFVIKLGDEKDECVMHELFLDVKITFK
ncbi:hypothetical protein HY627_01675 [Candidatus Uhrbacteria bacterium]|nr:hypothetical protein [Candidatus Uhrbacteria bacterium]